MTRTDAPAICQHAGPLLPGRFGDSARGAQPRVCHSPALADDRPADAQGLDRSRRSSTASRWKGPFVRIRFRWLRCAKIPQHLAMLEQWMLSYKPQELFDRKGRLIAEFASCRRRATCDERQPARQWWTSDDRTHDAEFLRLRAGDARPRHGDRREHRIASGTMCATSSS